MPRPFLGTHISQTTHLTHVTQKDRPKMLIAVILVVLIATGIVFSVILQNDRLDDDWYEDVYTNDGNYERFEVELTDLESAPLDIQFVSDSTLLLQLSYLADRSDDLTVVGPDSGWIGIRGNEGVKALSISLGDSIVYDIEVSDSSNLTTTVTFNENALMNGSYLSYRVTQGSLDINLNDETNFVGNETSTIRVWFSPESPDVVDLDIALPSNIGGYAFLEPSGSIDIITNGWYPSMYVEGKYPDYATERREGYKMALYIQAADIAGVLE